MPTARDLSRRPAAARPIQDAEEERAAVDGVAEAEAARRISPRGHGGEDGAIWKTTILAKTDEKGAGDDCGDRSLPVDYP